MKTASCIWSSAGCELTYYCVNARPKRPASHNLSASQSEAARSESVGPEGAPALGSSSFITDATGYAVQHLQYLPFGEPKRLLALSSRTPLKIFSESEQTFVDQQTSAYDTRYTFSAKEKPAYRNVSSGRDDETQYSYFEAKN